MKEIYLGTDSGATTSKTCGVFADGTPISLKLAQSSTNSQLGTTTVIEGWIEGIDKFLNANGLLWDQVRGVGLAIPGPYQRYGVLDRSANLPAAFAGWDFHADYSQALAKRAALLCLDAPQRCLRVTVEGHATPLVLPLKGMYPEQLALHDFLKRLQDEALTIARHRQLLWMQSAEAA